MKYLMAVLMLVLLLALGAWQGTAKSNDSARNEHATGQAVPVATADNAMMADKANASEQKAEPQAKTNNQGKLSLSLGSMPCPPNDQQCREREKKKFSPQEDQH